MRILIIGSGAREHAMAWSLSREIGSASQKKVFCLPGNAGTESLARNLPIDPEDIAAVMAASREHQPDIVIVGPEGPLAAGLVDALEAQGIAAFGPSRKAAALEASKAFARAFSQRHGVPCADTARFDDRGSFISYLDRNRGKLLVLKKSGLAAGKGVFESDDFSELAHFGETVLESDELLVEEFLVGRELSVFALCDRTDHMLLPACADHKKAGPNDIGPNTGGMGAVCPVPLAEPALMSRIEKQIIDPTFRGMEKEGLSYRGVLFFGIMATAAGPKLLEYNVRFGDPETQSLIPLLDSSFADLCASTAGGRLCSFRPSFSGDIACGVVIAAPGYPGSYPKGLAVEIDPQWTEEPETGSRQDSLLFHASTTHALGGEIRTGGGRCFTAVGIGKDWSSAREKAYELASAIRFEGAWYRPDIGDKLHRA